MAKKKKQKLDLSANSEYSSGFGRTFGASLSEVGLQNSLPKKMNPTKNNHQQSPSMQVEDLLSPLGPKRVLKLAISKKGRGGKTVTTVQVLAHSTEMARERLAKAMGKALGCRVWHEDGLLCLQGEQRERIDKWVTEQA
ncbi:MAG: hypothetical protein CMH49_02865 [Myxococcales bacterium]|nr:hypothetical protein [Myxococcales bacterium]